MKLPRTKPHHTVAREILTTSLAWALIGFFFLVGAHSLVLYFQADSLQIEGVSPVDEKIVEKGSAITFRATFVSDNSPITYSLRLSTSSRPTQEDEIYSGTVNSGGTMAYTIYANDYAAGTYYWTIYATDASEDQELVYYRSFTIVNPASGNSSGSSVVDNAPPITEGSIGTCDSGPGGHESSSTGEKTLNYRTLRAGESYFLRFNKVDFHSIEKIRIDALATLKPNGVIIHQELKKVSSLPKIDNVYKVFDIQLTTGGGWKNNEFYATTYFRFPKEQLAKNGHSWENVALFQYDFGVWNPVPTFLEREEETYYVFRATTQGLVPFVTGSCHKTWHGYPVLSR